MAAPYAHIDGPAGGQRNPPGFRDYFLFAPVRDFDDLQTLADPETAVTLEERVEITADHTFLVGKGFIRVYSTIDRNSLTGELTGGRDGRGKKYSVEAFFPGFDTEALGLLDQAMNDKCIVLIPLFGNGGTVKHFQLGLNGITPEIMSKEGTGKVGENTVRGSEVMIECYQEAACIYTGVVTELP